MTNIAYEALEVMSLLGLQDGAYQKAPFFL